jgi:hypothetical protein
MFKLKIKFLSLFTAALLIIFSVFPQDIAAQSEFSTKYDISYTVNTSGITTTRQVITLTNKLENLYATEYLIVIGSTKLSEITASDESGSLEPEVKVQDNTTNINLRFDTKVVGKDRSRTIVVTYKTPDFATVKGKVLEVGFPVLANSQQLDSYNVTIAIPSQFGEPTQIVPPPKTQFQSNNYLNYAFSQETLANKKGITATFGTEQILNFSLRYNLENKQPIKGRAHIALPPDTTHQHILYNSLEPKPENVTVDFDGNWLAEYIVLPQSSMTILAKGTVKITVFPQEQFIKELTELEFVNFTKPDKYWEVNLPKVKNLAQQLGSAEEIYSYLVDNFIYDYGRLENNTERLGAVRALDNPDNAICMEFTDAFISLSRAIGIPAREHNGYAHTENSRLRPLSLEQDILHSWPEYYDANMKRWVQIDPTWGNTTGGLDFFHKFDLDHFTFVIHGLESTYPPAAASYKTEEASGKDIEVTFGDTFNPEENLEIKVDLLPVKYLGLPIIGKLIINNTGNSAIYNTPVLITAHVDDDEIWSGEYDLSVLPPYGKSEYPIKLLTSWQDKEGVYEVSVRVQNKEYISEIPLTALVKPLTLIILGGGGFGTLLWLIGYSFARKQKLSLFRKRP